MPSFPVRRPALVNAVALLMVVAGVAASSPLLGADRWLDPDLMFWSSIVGTALGIATFAWLCVFVRCERCDSKLFWYAVSKRPHSDSTGWFFTATDCPSCGHSRVSTN